MHRIYTVMHRISYELYPLGDAALVVRFGQQIAPEVHIQVRALAASLDANPFAGLVEYVPAYTTVTVYYDPWMVSSGGTHHHAYDKVADILQKLCEKLDAAHTMVPDVVEIPVCYGGAYGPDLEYVASYQQIAAQEVIALHTSAVYTVYMLGFAPGFPYLGGMPKRIATPRRDTPRQYVPAGSVGIAGAQTGIYPMETPGGWQLIGQTYVSLFDPIRNPPALLKAGDQVRFVAVSEDNYQTGEHIDEP